MEPDGSSLQKMIVHIDALRVQIRKAQGEVATQIRNEDSELAQLLVDLWPDVLDQDDWLFKKLFRRHERPVDLIVCGRGSEVRSILIAILHGIYL